MLLLLLLLDEDDELYNADNTSPILFVHIVAGDWVGREEGERDDDALEGIALKK